MKYLQHLRSHRSIRLIVALAFLVVAALAMRELGGGGAPAGSAAGRAVADTVPVSAAVAVRTDVPEIVDAIGTVQSIDSVSVQPRVTGAITKIEFTPGQDVKQGQELFLIDPRPYQAALDQAKAQLAHDKGVLAEAQLDLARYQKLENEKSIAAQTAQDQAYAVEQDKGTVQLDQANVETAQLNLDYCHITAPISGRAGALLVDLGNLVGPQTAGAAAGTTSGAATGGQTTAASTLVSIAQLQPIYVSFSVPQTSIGRILRHQAAGALEIDAYSQGGKLLEKGKLTVIDNRVNTSTGTVLLQGTFANAHEALWPGEFVTVQLVAAMRRNVVTVPASAVMAGPNGSYVYVIGTNEEVERVNVQVAAHYRDIAVIGKGVSAGRTVVTDGQYRLADGVKVAIRHKAEPEPKPQAQAEAD